MKYRNDIPMWAVGGIFGSLALGFILIPFRDSVSASNLAFAFLALTIVVAELGGRIAGMITAVVSAMTLNFFLTEPYLTLDISKREDLIAFFALAICGLIAAAFGKSRRKSSAAAERASAELGILQHLTAQLHRGASLNDVLGDLRERFRLNAVIFRDAEEKILASDPADARRDPPKTALTVETLLPQDNMLRLGTRGFRLPPDGGRLRLDSKRGTHFLDLWEGDAEGFNIDERQTLAIAASLLVSLAANLTPTSEK